MAIKKIVNETDMYYGRFNQIYVTHNQSVSLIFSIYFLTEGKIEPGENDNPETNARYTIYFGDFYPNDYNNAEDWFSIEQLNLANKNITKQCYVWLKETITMYSDWEDIE